MGKPGPKTGYNTIYQPCAAVFHSHNLTLKQTFERCLKYYQTLFLTIYKDRTDEICNMFHASLVERAISFRRFLVQEQLMHPLQAAFYAPFCEYVNYLGCKFSLRKISKLHSREMANIPHAQQPQNQAIS